MNILIKHLQDCLFRFFKNELGIDDIDDSNVVDVHCYKSFVENGKQNMVFVQLKESHFNLRFDLIEKPDKVYIFPPDDDLKKFLKKNKIKVKEKKEQSNTVIHLISGPITPAKALEIGNMIDEVESFAYIGITGNEEPDPETMQALEMAVGGKTSIKVEWIGQDFNKILEWLKSYDD